MPSELPYAGKVAASELASTDELADELARAQRQLKKLNRLFDVALNNMARGLAVFDDDRRLVVCNRHFAEIYGLPDSLARPGTPYADIDRYLRDHDDRSAQADGENTWIETHVSKLARGETVSYDRHLGNGQSVRTFSYPLSDGGWVDIHELVGERRKDEQRIAWLAKNDPLTEVGNPLYFGEEMENALRQLPRGVSFALHWVDIDQFAQINDKFGQAVGDALLKQLAGRLVKTVRQHDLVARLGGDEFAIIQAGIRTQAEAERLTKRMLQAVAEPFDIDGHEIFISASCGVVLAPQHGTSSLELIKNVYFALAAAKAAGRATHAVFNDAEHAAVGES